jgi:hypothetical protein
VEGLIPNVLRGYMLEGGPPESFPSRDMYPSPLSLKPVTWWIGIGRVESEEGEEEEDENLDPIPRGFVWLYPKGREEGEKAFTALLDPVIQSK